MKEPDPDPGLAAWADAELKQLPRLEAPPGLVPAVLERLRTRAQRAWWLRVWWEWPVQAKVASILLALSLTGALSGGGLLLDQRVAAYSEQVTERLSVVAAIADTLATLWHTTVLVGTQPLVLTALVGVGVCYLLCLGLGTVLVRSFRKRA